MLSRRWFLLICIGGLLRIDASEPEVHWLAGGHTLGVASVHFLPDGQRLLSATADVEVKLWDLPSRKLLWASSDGNFGPSGIAVAPDGSFYLASATQLDTNVITRALSGTFPTTHVGPLLVMPSSKAISPSGQRAAAAGFTSSAGAIGNPDLRVWNLSAAREIASLPAELLSELGPITHVEFITEDDLIIGALHRIIRWSVQGTVQWRRSVLETGNLEALALSPNRSRLLIEENRLVQLLDTSTGESLWTLTDAEANSWRACFDAGGNRFALAFSDSPPGVGRIEIHSSTDGALLQTIPTAFNSPVPAFSPDGLTLACGHLHGIHLIPLAGSAEWEALTEVSGPIRVGAVSTARNWAASSTGQQLDLRRLDTGERFRSFTIGISSALASAPDGSWLAFTTNSAGLARYRPATDQFDAPAIATGPLLSLTVSQDGRRLLAIPQSDEAVMIDTDSWTVTARPKGSSPQLAAWAPDASRVTIGSRGLAQTYELDSREPRATRDWGTDLIRFLGYLSDGETLLSLHRSGQLRRWRVTDGTLLFETNIGTVSPTAVVLSPDRRLLLVSESGKGIRILDATTGTEWDHWIRDTGYQVNHLSFSEDATWLLNTRLDGAVAAIRAPFVMHSVHATASGFEFSISGGNGPYQLQRHPGTTGIWSNIGEPFEGHSLAVPTDGAQPGLYRLVTAPQAP